MLLYQYLLIFGILSLWSLQVLSQDTVNSFSSEHDSNECEEFGKNCHCGSIAQGPGTKLYTQIKYPNQTTVIEGYNEDVPYEYKKNLKVYYRCADEENILVGNNVRQCLYGKWNGSVPRCAFNLRNNTKLNNVKIYDNPINMTTLYSALELVPNGTFQIPLKNQPSHCLQWSLSPKQMWILSLSQPTKVHYVRIKLYGDQIKDLYLNNQISFYMFLGNITHIDDENKNKNHNKLPIDLKCTNSNRSYYDSDEQKYSANYLVLEFLCEKTPSFFEYYGTIKYYVYDYDRLYTNLIEVRFVHNLNKLSKISLCELKLYTFSEDCGTLDIPVNVNVQREVKLEDVVQRKAYKYICADKEDQLKGNTYIQCDIYGKWNFQFPQCVSINPCQLLNLTTNDQNYELNIKYESISLTKTGKQVIPNGEDALISCLDKRKQNRTEISHKIIRVCINGKWFGLGGELEHCKKLFENESKFDKQNPTTTTNEENFTISKDNEQLVAIRLILIMFGAFIVLVLIIISFCICPIFRRSKNTNTSKTHKRKNKLNNNGNHKYAEINYDLTYYSSIKLYLELHDAKRDDLQNKENFQYEKMAKNVTVNVQEETINDTYTPMTKINS